MVVNLVSTSPRRRELLKRIVPVFNVLEPRIKEEPVGGGDIEGSLKEIALSKLQSVEFEGFGIAADTVVVLGGKVLGKPGSEAEAFSMLESLSGRWHEVFSAVAVSCKEKVLVELEVTRVRFRKLDPEEIRWYVESFKPLDKAGAYGIQDAAEVFVESIEGSYSNVVGLPLRLTYEMLKKLGFKPCRWVKLGDIAKVVRSKNAGPFEVTFDVIFDDKEAFERFRKGNYLTPESFARLYGISCEDILVFEYLPQAMALKITVKRKVPSGSIGDEDIYAAQQYIPLMNYPICWKSYGG